LARSGNRWDHALGEDLQRSDLLDVFDPTVHVRDAELAEVFRFRSRLSTFSPFGPGSSGIMTVFSI
jgi:hypothetical protein